MTDRSAYVLLPFLLPQVPVAALVPLGEEKAFARGEILCHRGELASYCYAVLSGYVAGYGRSTAAEEHVESLMGPGCFFLAASVLLDKPAPLMLRTLAPCRLSCIPRQALRQAIHASPDAAAAYAEAVALNCTCAMEQARNARNHSAAWNACDFLLRLTARQAQNRDGMVRIHEPEGPLSLSQMLGGAAEEVRLVFKSLRDEGLLLRQGGDWYLASLDALTRYRDTL